MKRLLVPLVLFVTASSSLLARDWPVAVVQYEALALQQPGEGLALRQLNRYAVENGCFDELMARWEGLAAGPQEPGYRILLSRCLTYAGSLDAARAQLQKAVAAAPESPTAWLALGEFELVQGTPEAGPALEKARVLGLAAGDPGTAIESLAADHLAHGRATEALDTLESGWSQVKAPATRWRIIAQWVDVAYSHHALNKVREKLEGALEQGNDRAADLAQFYFAIGDYAQASAILAPALQAHPEEAGLRAQELTIARAAKRTSEVARLLREEARFAPTPEKWRDLFVVLVENGETEPARELINTQGDALAATAATWHGLISRLWQLQLTPDIEKMLAAHPAWEATLTRAEAFIADGRREQAEPLLWTLFDAKQETEPLSSFAREAANGAFFFPSALPGTDLDSRYSTLAYLSPDSETVFVPLRWFRGNAVRKWQTLYEARGWAAFYLAIIAADAGQAPALIDRLKAATTGWPIGERLLIWSVVESAEPLLHEIETAVAQDPSNPFPDRFCRVRLEAFSRSASVTPAFLERVQAALAAIKTAPNTLPRPLGPMNGRLSLGRDPELKEASEAFLRGDYGKAVSAFREVMEKRREKPDQAPVGTITSQYQTWMLPQIAPLRARPDKLTDATVAMLQMFAEGTVSGLRVKNLASLELTQNVPPGSFNPFGYGGFPPVSPYQLEQEVQKKLIAPPTRLFNPTETSMLWSIFSATREPRLWNALKPRLDDSLKEISPPARKFARLSAAYLLWWHGEWDVAVQRLRDQLKEADDADVRVVLAAMLRKLERPAEAKAVLDSMPAPYPAFAHQIDGWRLILAAEAKDAAAVKELMTKQKDAPAELPVLRTMANALDRAGYKEEALLFYQRISEQSSAEEDRDQWNQALTDATEAANNAATLTLARKILQDSPLQEYRFGSNGADLRSRAAEALRQSGASEAYLAGWERTVGTAVDEGERAVRKAEMSENADTAIAAWRKVLEKQPGNREALRKLVRKMSSENSDRREVFEAFLAVAPEEAFSSYGEQMIQSYQKENDFPRFVEKLEKAPFPQKSIWWKSSSTEFPWSSLVSRLTQRRENELAIRVLRRATQVLDPVPISLRQSLVRELMLRNHREEAGQELLQTLAPEPGAEPLLFALHRNRVTQFRSADAEFDNLKLVQELGVLPALQARLTQTRANDVSAQQMQMWVRLLAHDPAALPDMDAYLKGTGKSLLSDETRLKKLVETVASWKEAAPLTKTLLAAFDQASTRQVGFSRTRIRLEMAKIMGAQGDQEYVTKAINDTLQLARTSSLSDQLVKALRQAGEVASFAQNKELLGLCEQILAEKIAENPLNNFYTEDAFFLYGLASEAGRAKEGAQLVAALRQYGAKHAGTNLRERLRLIEIRSEWDKGEFRQSQPIIWHDVQHSTPTESSVVWDIGAVVSSNGSGRHLVGRASAAAAADHRYTVELFAGSSESSMESLLRRSEAEVHGAWRGALPAGTEFIRVVLSDGDRLLLSEPMRISLGANLLPFEKREEWSVAAETVKPVDGGPIPGGQYLSYRPESSTVGSGQNNVSVGRVKIQPGKNYLVSGWLRAASDRPVYLSWQYLNGQNAPLSTGSLTEGNGLGNLWSFGSLYLHSSYDQQTNGVRLPEGAAAIEFSVAGGSAGFDAADISLIEVPDSKPTP